MLVMLPAVVRDFLVKSPLKSPQCFREKSVSQNAHPLSSNIVCVAFCRWVAQEEAFKKRINQLEWKEEMYNSLQVEKELKVCLRVASWSFHTQSLCHRTNLNNFPIV